MPARPATVKQADVTRYARGLAKAGIVPGRVLFHPDGTVEVIPQGAEPSRGIGPDPDELLK